MATNIRRQQPYTVKISRQLADHTMLEVIFADDDDAHATRRMALIMDAFDARMHATNRAILEDNAWVEAERTRIKAEVERERADALNGATDGDSHRAPHVPADS